MSSYENQWNQNVSPSDWQNPVPTGRYNLVVLGGGTAGLVAAAGAAGLGGRVALIERDRLGGDCLNWGCVPSKALLSSGRQLMTGRRLIQQGIGHGTSPVGDFAAIMQRMQRLRAGISRHDSARRFQDLGVDVFLGEGRFTSPDTIGAGGTELRFAKALIATGSSPRTLDLAGGATVPILTNETIFQLQELPKRLLVIGGGPIGCEMAQAMNRFGSQVTVVQKGPQILPREAKDAAQLVAGQLEAEGVRLLTSARVTQVVTVEAGHEATVQTPQGDDRFQIDAVLVAIGRRPNLDGLGLEQAGIEYHDEELPVNDRFQTTNRRVYASGDVAGPWQFTHAADFMSRSILQNALFWGRKKRSALIVPRCTYTSPELAAVGISAVRASDQGDAVTTLRVGFADVDRAVLDGDPEGWAEVYLRTGSDRILGATIVGEQAGELISQICLAMTQKIGLGAFAATMYPYPTRAEVIRKLGDQYQRTRLTPWVASLFRAWLNWQRGRG